MRKSVSNRHAGDSGQGIHWLVSSNMQLAGQSALEFKCECRVLVLGLRGIGKEERGRASCFPCDNKRPLAHVDVTSCIPPPESDG